MKKHLTVHYDWSPSGKCVAWCWVGDQRFVGVGDTWSEAKEELLQKVVAAIRRGKPPEPENVTLEV